MVRILKSPLHKGAFKAFSFTQGDLKQQSENHVYRAYKNKQQSENNARRAYKKARVTRNKKQHVQKQTAGETLC